MVAFSHYIFTTTADSVRRQLDFKISTLVHRLLAGTAPVFLADECYRCWPLSAVLCSLLTIERVWSRDHATSSVTAVLPLTRPTLWNSLPEQLWQPDITFGQFKQSLKTFMFG